MSDRPKFVTEKHLTYLDDLRVSGVTNMYGATPYLEKEFPELSHAEAGVALVYWMRSFVIRQEVITRGDQ